MESILDMFSDCDTFSLTIANRVSELPEIEKQRLPNANIEREKQNLNQRYNKLKEKYPDLEDFNVLYNEIFDECEKFQKNISGKNLIEDFSSKNSPFICDHVGKDTKYSEPIELFWHMYHNIHFVLMANEDLTILPVNNEVIIYPLQYPENNAIRKNFIKHEFTFDAPYMPGVLQLVCHFKLNDETKEWLTQFETDFAIDKTGFENLALYANGEIKFSSCTHEGFNSLD